MATKLDEIISHFSAVTSSSINDEKAAAFCTSRAFEAVEITFNTFCSNEFTRLSLCVVDFNNMYMYMCVCVCVRGGWLLPGEKPFLCEADGCGRSFAEYSSLRKHMLVHSGEWDRVYSCTAERSFLL